MNTCAYELQQEFTFKNSFQILSQQLKTWYIYRNESLSLKYLCHVKKDLNAHDKECTLPPLFLAP